MDDQPLPTDSQPDLICPWCSAALIADAAVCPSCGAILTSNGEEDLPGLTAVDAQVARGTKRSGSRSRLLSWISGDYQDDAPAEADSRADAQALAPPDPDVQREILRLELEAEIARLQGEADSMRSDAMAEDRVPDLPEEMPATEDASGAAETGAGQTPA